ncbi:MAG: hypothetical protein KAI24_01670 [Planctomycetes bacterium]|nr:hypothetical protein [Planctomycetota bacterium]
MPARHAELLLAIHRRNALEVSGIERIANVREVRGACQVDSFDPSLSVGFQVERRLGAGEQAGQLLYVGTELVGLHVEPPVQLVDRNLLLRLELRK